jgi:uncharacterized protein (TIGR01244 family)
MSPRAPWIANAYPADANRAEIPMNMSRTDLIQAPAATPAAARRRRRLRAFSAVVLRAARIQRVPARAGRWPITWIAIASLTLLAGCAAVAPTAKAPGLELIEALPGLYTSGQPAPGDWSAIAARGVATVVNLRTADEPGARDEAAEVRAAGLHYVQIPVAGADGITTDNARRLHEALSPDHGPVLVHCASGNRAGALLALEQADFHGVPADAALALGRKAGMTSTEPRLRQALGLGP